MLKQILLVAAFFLLLCTTVNAQIYRVAQMNTEQIRALDKQKTVVILTGGILEQHGPHLPSYSDVYVNEWRSERLAEAITERSGWAALMFPTIPLGSGGANEIGGKYVFPGTYAVRSSTVRAVFMDLATELGEQGFRWIVIMHGHGAPHNNLALEQAGDYFRDTYGGRMIHLVGLQPTPEQYAKAKLTVPEPELTEAEAKENGPDIHSGYDETSAMLFLRPDLVNPIYKKLPPLSVSNPVDQYKIANAANWLGYLGSPVLVMPHLAHERCSGVRHKLRRLCGRLLTAFWTNETFPATQSLCSTTKMSLRVLKAHSKTMRVENVNSSNG